MPEAMSDPLPPAPPIVDGDGKIWAVFAHLSAYVGLPFILPLIIYLVKRNESAFVAENAREALNFHLTLILYCFVCGLFTIFLFCTFFPLAILFVAVLGLVPLILSILAAVRASEGGVFRYPCTLRLV
jgi:hypothetical protein